MARKKTKKRKTVRRKKKTLPRIPEVEIRPDQILLHERTILLFDEITQERAYKVVQQLIALDKIDSKDPILLVINSPGGSVSDGFAIIDAMKGIRSSVITMITGEACSMAGIISIAGDHRIMSSTAVWMAHNMRAGIIDYVEKIKDRAKFYSWYEDKCTDFLKAHTKLSRADITKAINGELWLDAQKALEKGVVDKVVGK